LIGKWGCEAEIKAEKCAENAEVLRKRYAKSIGKDHAYYLKNACLLINFSLAKDARTFPAPYAVLHIVTTEIFGKIPRYKVDRA
jgi:hypothetical protein